MRPPQTQSPRRSRRRLDVQTAFMSRRWRPHLSEHAEPREEVAVVYFSPHVLRLPACSFTFARFASAMRRSPQHLSASKSSRAASPFPLALSRAQPRCKRGARGEKEGKYFTFTSQSVCGHSCHILPRLCSPSLLSRLSSSLRVFPTLAH